MEYILFDKNPQMVDAWKEFFSDQPNVKIVMGDLNSIHCDAVVSPANSFGFMDGGIDHAISKKLGWDLQTKLQAMISTLPEGELLIGNALIVDTGHSEIPFLVSAPTMRVPTNFNIATSINAYLAMKATLVKVKSHPPISSVAIPGFCTGTGGMKKETAARQMFMAFREIVLEQRVQFASFNEARQYQFDLNPDGLVGIH